MKLLNNRMGLGCPVDSLIVHHRHSHRCNIITIRVYYQQFDIVSSDIQCFLGILNIEAARAQKESKRKEKKRSTINNVRSPATYILSVNTILMKCFYN